MGRNSILHVTITKREDCLLYNTSFMLVVAESLCWAVNALISLFTICMLYKDNDGIVRTCSL